MLGVNESLAWLPCWLTPIKSASTLWRRQPISSFVGRRQPQLAICLCVDEQHCFPCASVQWGTHQCYDRWHAQHRCLWPALPVASTKMTATQWLGSMPRRAKWEARGSAVHLSRDTALECCHHRWTHLWPTSNRVGPWQCPAWQCDNHHSGSYYHTGTTPSLAATVEPSNDIGMTNNQQLQGGLGAAVVGFPHHLDPYLPAQYAKERAAISSPGGSDTKWSNRGSLQTEWGGPSCPCPNGKPYSGVSAGSHTRRCTQYYSCQSLTIPANYAKNPGGGQHLPHPTTLGFPQGWSSWTARGCALLAGANECGPRAATHNQDHYGLPL